MRVLFTNNTLAGRGGTELYVRDVALALLARGVSVVAYSPALGEVAQELRAATVPVVGDLDRIGDPPDLIHGHHHVETMAALLRFPGVPAISYCHGWLPFEETPPRFPRIRRYVAVDRTCLDRLVLEHGIPAASVELLLNFVDLRRFTPRAALPEKPRRALVFSNAASERTYLPAVREACRRSGVELDVLGAAAGRVCARPEEVLGQYDLVFAKARAALEAMAVGAAVVLCDGVGSGPLVTSAELDRLRPLNFGIRTLDRPVDADHLAGEIARYDAADAARVSERIRATAGLEAAVDRLVALYEAVLAEHRAAPPSDPAEELRAASRYLVSLNPRIKEIDALRQGLAVANAERDAALVAGARLASERDGARAEVASLRATALWRLATWVGSLPVLGRVAGALIRVLAGRGAARGPERGPSR